ncbi:uncharacterized protein WCC33_012255 [Rhinophrynus dorsalis]
MGFWAIKSLVQLLILALSLSLLDQIQAETIESICPPNTRQGCKRQCYSNCDNLNSTTEACNKMCEMGCDCLDGYVFKSKGSNICVPVRECQVSCPEHSKFNECYRFPRKSCATLGMHPVPARFCMPRCVCDEGYVLSNEIVPRCIKIKECPKEPKN